MTTTTKLTRRDVQKNQIERFTELQTFPYEKLLEMAKEAGVEIADGADQAAVISALVEAGFDGDTSTGEQNQAEGEGIQPGATVALKTTDKSVDEAAWKADKDFMQLARNKITKNKNGNVKFVALLYNKDGGVYERTLFGVKIEQQATLDRVLKMISPLQDNEHQKKLIEGLKKNPEKYEKVLVQMPKDNRDAAPQARRAYNPDEQRDADSPMNSFVMLYIREIQKNVKAETI